MPDDEEQLLAKAVQGDEGSLTTLLERVGFDLHVALERQIGPQYRGLLDADDIMQVTCLEAFLHIRKFTPGGPGTFATWLRRVAENNLRDAIRELERDKRPPPGKRVAAPVGDESYVALVERLATTTATASRTAARREVREAVESAISRLPADYQTVLRLYEIEGLSGPEVAERMQRSHGAVRMMLARARESLAEQLGSESQFFGSSA